MKIKYLNSGGVAEQDLLINVDFCCQDMMMASICDSQFSFSKKGYLHLIHSNKVIKFCPFCGSIILRERSMI